MVPIFENSNNQNLNKLLKEKTGPSMFGKITVHTSSYSYRLPWHNVGMDQIN